MLYPLQVAGVLLILLAACGAPNESQVKPPAATPTDASATATTAVSPPTATSEPDPSASPAVPATPAPTTTPPPTLVRPLRVAAEPAVPTTLVTQTQQLVADNSHFIWSDDPTRADLTLAVNAGAPLATWIYAVAVPFPTVRDGIAMADWDALGTLLLEEKTADTLAVPFDLPDYEVVGGVETAVWQPDTAPALRWTILPFERLKPTLKVLRLDGQSPLDAVFDPTTYPLTVTIGVSGAPGHIRQWQTIWPQPTTNRDLSRLTRVAMTGPSGLARAVANRMERHGIHHPARHVAPVFSQVDIAHLSNEVPFAPNCPPEEQEATGDTIFCAPDRYLALMTYLGQGPEILINEMTGNHVNDWGREHLLHTFALYEEAGIRWFGGGRDETAAREPLLITHNGNRLAFVGCNAWGPPQAWATDNAPGALRCEEDFSFLQTQIRSLGDSDYRVIATVQYVEYYHYDPPARQQHDFRQLAAAGATIVSGSHAHHAQGMGFHANAFIHYGLGNLVFDQMDMPGTRQSFIDVYTFYDNRLLNVDLWTGLIENYCCPRPMTVDERRDLLTTIFAAGDWNTQGR